ncbi:MAG: hypothetical protein RL661_1424 [Pseudomonadota bacterium]
MGGVMEQSIKNLKIRFGEIRQERARRTLENILQAADELVEAGDDSAFDARNLSRRSGYALGSLVNRLGAIENVFLYAIAKARSRHLNEIAIHLKGLGKQIECKEFCAVLAEESIRRIRKINPAVIRFYEKRAMARAASLNEVYCYTDEIIAPLLELIHSNETGTFRKLSQAEAKYVCRSMFVFVDRPFVEGDHIAGTEEHKSLIIENISRLLATNS